MSKKKSSAKKNTPKSKTSKRGLGLLKWNYVRSEIKKVLDQSGVSYSRQKLNGDASKFYNSIKSDFSGNIGSLPAVYSAYSIGIKDETVPHFSWWEIVPNFELMSKSKVVRVDNSVVFGGTHENSFGFDLNVFVGTVGDFLDHVIGDVSNKINSIYRRKQYLYYINYEFEMYGKTYSSYHLVAEGDPMLDYTREEYEDWMLERGLSLPKYLLSNEEKSRNDFKDYLPLSAIVKKKSASKKKKPLVKVKSKGKSKPVVTKSKSVAKKGANKGVSDLKKKEARLRRENPEMTEKQIKRILNIFKR